MNDQKKSKRELIQELTSLRRQLNHLESLRGYSAGRQDFGDEEYRAIVENVQEGIWMIDSQGITTFVNSPMADMLGCSVEDMLGKHLFSFMDDAAREECARNIKRSEQGITEQHEFTFRRKDGTLIQTRLKTSPITDGNGGYAGAVVCVEDITNHKYQEEQLRQSEERYRTVADFTYDWESWLGPDRKYRYISPSVERITGYTPEEITQDPELVRRIIHPDFQDWFSRHLTEDFEKNEVFHFDFRILHRNGEERWISHYCQPVYDAAGRFRGRRASNRDITEHKRAEEASRQSEKELAAAQRIAHIGSWTWNLTTDTAHWSDETFRIFGLTGSSLEQHRRNFLDFIHPDDRLRVDQALTDALNGIKAYDLDYRIRRFDGSERILHAQAEVVHGLNDKPILMQGTVQDITEHKRAEEALQENERKFRQMADNIEEVFLIQTADLEKVIYVSPAYEKIWGRSCESLYEDGCSWFESVHPEDRDKVNAEIARQMETGFFSTEYRILRPDGEIRWIWARTFPVHNEAGQVYRTAGIAVDITERVLTQEQLHKSQAELAHALRVATIGELTTTLAHELNQPLCSILSLADTCIDVLKTGSLPREEILPALQEVASQAERAGRIIHNIRHFARKGEPKRSTMDVNETIRNCTHFLAQKIKQAKVTLELGLSDQLPPIQADQIQIEQVILNLLQNSLDAMAEANRERRELLVESTMQDANHVLICVRDNGGGTKEMERIFEPFYTT